MDSVDINESIAVVILNYKDYNLTITAVKQLLHYKLDLDIIIVDNNSPNESFTILSEEFNSNADVHVIKSERNGGYSYGNNYGVRYILSRKPEIAYVVIMNPDVIIPYRELFSNLVSKIKGRKDIAVISPMPLLNGNFNIINIGWKLPKRFDKFFLNSSILKRLYKANMYHSLNVDYYNSTVANVEVLPGSFFLIKRDIFEKIGMLDENVFLYEEEDILASKLQKLDFKLVVSLTDIYLHNHTIKDENLMNIGYKIRDFKIVIQSQKYFILNFMHKGKFYWPFIAITGYLHLFLEIPVNHVLKRCLSAIRKK